MEYNEYIRRLQEADTPRVDPDRLTQQAMRRPTPVAATGVGLVAAVALLVGLFVTERPTTEENLWAQARLAVGDTRNEAEQMHELYLHVQQRTEWRQAAGDRNRQEL